MTPDGNLPAARARLDKAISAVFAPIYDRTNNETRVAPSLYTQLVDAIPGVTGERSGSRAGMPLWVDALDCRNEIITWLATWQPKGRTAEDRLRQLEGRPWRPQDVGCMDGISAEMEKWPGKIRAIIYPERHWAIPAPCPACGATIVYRRDSSGEEVRQAALQIDSAGCRCQRCRAWWPPDRFAHLARVLGYEPDASLVEGTR